MKMERLGKTTVLLFSYKELLTKNSGGITSTGHKGFKAAELFPSDGFTQQNWACSGRETSVCEREQEPEICLFSVVYVRTGSP